MSTSGSTAATTSTADPARLVRLVAQLALVTSRQVQELASVSELIVFISDELLKNGLAEARRMWASRKPPGAGVGHPDGALKKITFLILVSALFTRIGALGNVISKTIVDEVRALEALGQEKLGGTVHHLFVLGRVKEPTKDRTWVWKLVLTNTCLGLRMRTLLMELTPNEWQQIGILDARDGAVATEVSQSIQNMGWLGAEKGSRKGGKGEKGAGKDQDPDVEMPDALSTGSGKGSKGGGQGHRTLEFRRFDRPLRHRQ